MTPQYNKTMNQTCKVILFPYEN